MGLLLSLADTNLPRVTPSISRSNSEDVSRGFVKEGYEPLRDLFDQLARDGQLHKAQCCVFVRGEKVAELWTSETLEADDYGHDHLQNIFSSSKVLTSLVVAMLVDRGRLRYDQLVSEVWPEYAQNGKENTTVANIMRHESGLARFDFSASTIELTTERIKSGALSDRIARQTPSFPPGSKREYNGVTRGWIINEIVRRADEQGRTVGEFLRDEVATPLGMTDEMLIGTPDRLHGKIAPLCETSRFWWSWFQIVTPRFLGGGKVPFAMLLHKFLATFIYPLVKFGNPVGLSDFLRDADALTCAEDPSVDHKLFNMAAYNMPSTRRGEIPSCNCHASARALATVAAAVVGDGRVGSVTLMSEEGAKAAVANPVSKLMILGIIPSHFTNAGWAEFRDDRWGYVGWQGIGGSACQWHPDLKIGFGFAAAMVEPLPTNDRAAVLQKVALECAARQQTIKSSL